MQTFLRVMSVTGSILLALLILLVMVTVHEFGHYLAGKALKFKINEFAVGFGPRLLSRTSKKTGEVFSLRAFPLGGFCAFEGEDGEASSAGAFNNMAPWKRILVLLSGPLMNYLLALLLITCLILSFGVASYRVNSIYPDETGAYIGYSLTEEDVIIKVENKNIYLATDIAYALNGKKEGEEVSLTVLRGGSLQNVTIKLRADCNFKNSAEINGMWHALGVGVYPVTSGEGEEARTDYYYDLGVYNCRYGFFEALGRSFGYSFRLAGAIFRILGELLTGHLGISAMGGPVTTIKLTSQIAARDMQSFLQIAAYIGVNLAVFNLLPIPALDGSKIVFCLIEWIFRKPVPRKVEAVIHAIGFVAILAFAVLVDILQFI